MRLVIIESPYAGDVEANLKYLRECMRDSLSRGEAPFASHGLYTQEGVLKDGEPMERALGMSAGWAWFRAADRLVVYRDKGISSGMEKGISFAEKIGLPTEFRYLYSTKSSGVVGGSGRPGQGGVVPNR